MIFDKQGHSILFSPAVAGVLIPLNTADLDSFRLEPEEQRAVARAVPRRQREFAAGRLCARRAMEILGLPPSPIPVGKDREPLWPNGLVGSISHTAGYCVAVVALKDQLSALGVDAEEAEPLDASLWAIILTDAERKRALEHETDAGLIARLIFSAKEALYKAQFPITHEWLDFQDVEVTFSSRPAQLNGHFHVSVLRHGTLAAGKWMGSWAIAESLLLTGVERAAHTRPNCMLLG